ncbi:hypothetical protein [Peteryoungia algae]|uniref:hypothetical protein n=1 Tax=Peteryoungia algae TaxID=2919917 RepID=UPI0025A2B90F|nr:hypothetical protein [Rhizobium sp. SSM4.3]
MSGLLNTKGQSIYYRKVAGSVITGNEDGIKHAAMAISYALSHLGFTIPPQADCGWIGEAGPALMRSSGFSGLSSRCISSAAQEKTRFVSIEVSSPLCEG